MAKFITPDNIEALALGASVLGSGGGGSPIYEKLIARKALETYGPIKLISTQELKDEDLIAPISFMGAPLVSIERISSGKEVIAIYKEIEKIYSIIPSVLLSSEVGGSNLFVTFLLASRYKLPLLDADIMGRAFPELQMNSAELFKVNPCPAILADTFGNTVTFNTKNALTLERFARNVTIAAGSDAAICMYIMSGKQAKAGAVISGSISRALSIGQTILDSNKNQSDPIEQVIKKCDGKILGTGVITDINQKITDGFLNGTVKIHTPTGDIDILYQNEYLMAQKKNKVLATTPDLIVLLEQETGTPVMSETLTYGIRVAVIALKSPAIWQTPEGLALVGPKAFGY
jgi:DUF917 family protein